MRVVRSEMVDVLSPGETILMVLKQSILSNIAPDNIVVTDRNIILIHYSFWGRYIGRNIFVKTESTLVPYDRIAGILVDKGKLFTTVTVKIAGFGQSEYLKNTLGIEGLWHNDASILVSFIQGYKDEKLRNVSIKEVDAEEAKRLADQNKSKFIWLGRGSGEAVAKLLGVGAGQIINIDPGSIGMLWATELHELKDGILVDNYGALSPIMARYFKKMYNIQTYVLKGGTRELEELNSRNKHVNGSTAKLQIGKWFEKEIGSQHN